MGDRRQIRPVEIIQDRSVTRQGVKHDGVDETAGVLRHDNIGIRSRLLQKTCKMSPFKSRDTPAQSEKYSLSFQHFMSS